MRYNPLANDYTGPLDPATYADRDMQATALLNRMTLNGWKTDGDLLPRKVAQEADKREAAIEELRDVYGMPTHKPDRFKLKLKREWPESMQALSIAEARESLAVNPEKAVSFGLATRIPGERSKSPWATGPGKAAIMAAFGKAGANKAALQAVYLQAERDGARQYMDQVKAFGQACLERGAPADAPVFPMTDKGQVSLSKHTLGGPGAEPTWFCPARRQSFPTVYTMFGHIPEVARLCELLLLATGARMKFAEIASFVTEKGRVHAKLGAVQASGRFPFKEPSLTNVGARGAAIEEREVMVADDGQVLVSLDIAQGDVRAVAIASQDDTLISFLQPGEDMHMRFAGVFFGEMTDASRKRAKPITLALPYGMGAFALAQRNRLELGMVNTAVRNLEEEMPKRTKWIEDTRAEGAEKGELTGFFGRRLHVDKNRAYTQATAQIGQNLTREMLLEMMLRLVALADLDGKDARPHLRMTVHDSLILSVPEDEVEYWQELMLKAGTFEITGPEGKVVPILCDLGGPAYRWSDCDS